MLPTIISTNQSAFVEGRAIAQNVLICQDLVRLYNRKNTGFSCLIKIDLRKAYDSVEWEFVKEMLHAMNFPSRFINWTIKCITTTQYTIAINGDLYGDIQGWRGLRQGDPISPLIFVICTEYFTRLMNVVATQERFEYHTQCKSLKLNHLCFADDVLMFCKGEFQSILLMLRALKSFSIVSGLETNAAKSNIYGVNMTSQCVDDVCELTGYQKGALPFRYLGVPILARRISKIDCETLLNKMTAKVQSWGSRHLSHAGRVLLVNAVLLHIHTYWSAMFVLPKQVLKGITEVCRNFLWSGKVYTSRAPLMAWDLVCRTKKEGGLGITGCLIWNEAAVAKYVWNMAQKEDNLWVRWVDHIYIKGSDWWQYVIPKDSCWYWKKICHIRDRFIPGYNQNGWLKPDGKYTIASRYTWRRGEIAEWLWYRWIWGKGILPKHSFICWLSLHERFLRKEGLYRMGICQEDKCQ